MPSTCLLALWRMSSSSLCICPLSHLFPYSFSSFRYCQVLFGYGYITINSFLHPATISYPQESLWKENVVGRPGGSTDWHLLRTIKGVGVLSEGGGLRCLLFVNKRVSVYAWDVCVCVCFKWHAAISNWLCFFPPVSMTYKGRNHIFHFIWSVCGFGTWT